jgi:MFS family permease
MHQPTLSHQKPTQVRFGVLAFISSLSILTYLDRVCISRVQDDIKGDLGISDAGMGWVFGAFALGYGLFEVPGGWMGDVWGARRVLTRIVLWWSLFTALTGSIGWLSGASDQYLRILSWDLPVLLVLMVLVRFLFGCGEAGAYPNMARIVGRWFPYEERGLAQGVIWTFARIGGAMAPIVIGRLTFFLGWELAFVFLGILGLAWCACFYFWFKDRPEEMPSCNEAERALIRGPVRTAPLPLHEEEGITVRGRFSAIPNVLGPDHHEDKHTGAPWLKILTSPNIWALCLCGIFVNLAWYFIPTWQPRYFKDQFQISMEDSEILTGLPFLFGAAGAFLGGSFSDRLIRITGSRRWGRSLIGCVGFGGAGICLFLLGLVQNAFLAVALLCLFSFINDLAVPVIWAAATDIGGRYAGTVSGTMNMAGCIGAALSPILTGIILGHAAKGETPWPGIFALYSAAGIISGLAWLFIDAGKPLVPKEIAHKQ